MLVGTAAYAVSLRLSLEELVERADLVVQARIRSVPKASPGALAIDVETEVLRVVAGRVDPCAGAPRIRQGIGLSNGVRMEPGQVVIAFLQHVEGCAFLPVGGAQGVLIVEDDSVRWRGRSEPVSGLLRRIESLAAGSPK